MFFSGKRRNHSNRKGYTRVKLCERLQCLREAAVIHMDGGTKARDRMGRFKVQLLVITNILPPSRYLLRDRLDWRLEFLLIPVFLWTAVSSNIISMWGLGPQI